MKYHKKDVKRLQIQKQFPLLVQKEAKNQCEEVLSLLGYVQLDSMNVLSARSQDLFFYNRVHGYQVGDYLHLYQNQFSVEAYLHALSMILSDSALSVFSQRYYQKRYISGKAEREIIRQFRTSPADFIDTLLKTREQKKSWEMNSKDKIIDLLWRTGYLLVERDGRFKKKLLPNERLLNQEPLSDYTENTAVSRAEELIKIAFSNLSVASYDDIKKYFNLGSKVFSSAFSNLLKERVIVCFGEVQHRDYYMLLKDKEAIEKSLSCSLEFRCRFLSPFDNLIRERSRLEYLFDVNYKLESYMRSEHRKYGYYALPILCQESIVGFIDLKAERKNSTLVVKQFTSTSYFKSLHIDLIEAELERMKDFLHLEFLNTSNLSFGRL